MGPDLWNVFFESLLNRNVGPRNEIIAYADDALVVVRGNTRQEVERGLKLVLEELTEWSQDTKMEQSQTKTIVMTLQERIPNRGRRGGARDANRKFVARCDDMRVELVRGVRYLGVYIHERLKFKGHYRNVSTRTIREFAKLDRVSRANKLE